MFVVVCLFLKMKIKATATSVAYFIDAECKRNKEINHELAQYQIECDSTLTNCGALKFYIKWIEFIIFVTGKFD